MYNARGIGSAYSAAMRRHGDRLAALALWCFALVVILWGLSGIFAARIWIGEILAIPLDGVDELTAATFRNELRFSRPGSSASACSRWRSGPRSCRRENTRRRRAGRGETRRGSRCARCTPAARAPRTGRGAARRCPGTRLERRRRSPRASARCRRDTAAAARRAPRRRRSRSGRSSRTPRPDSKRRATPEHAIENLARDRACPGEDPANRRGSIEPVSRRPGRAR